LFLKRWALGAGHVTCGRALSCVLIGVNHGLTEGKKGGMPWLKPEIQLLKMQRLGRSRF
jgi:hypothetical protein